MYSVYHEKADSNKVKVVTDPFTGREPVGEIHLSVTPIHGPSFEGF